MSGAMARIVSGAAAVLLLLGGPLGLLPAEDPPHRTGLIPLNEEELAEVLATRPQIIRVYPNWLGLERINEVRRKTGRPLLDPASARPVGREVESAVGGRAPGAQILGEAGDIAADLPVAVDNSTLKFFPPVRDQGPLGSCAAFATTYYQLSHMTAFQRDWDIRDPADDTRKFSPKWTYNMVNGGADTGASFDQVFALLESHGAASWAELPYDADYRSWCLDPNVWRRALSIRTNPFNFIGGGASSDASIAYMKQLLTNGYILLFGTSILSWQTKTIPDDPSTEDDATEVGKTIGYWLNGEVGPHAMVIVGYNDAIWTDVNGNGMVEAGEKGGFRIANSWGTSWGDGGFIWLAYDALKYESGVVGGPTAGRKRAFLGDVVWVLTARDAYAPLLVGEFTLNHAMRNQLKLTLGRSATDSTVPTTLWTLAAIQNQGGGFAFDGTTTAVDAGFVLDYSDILEAGAGAGRYYLGLSDGPAAGAAILREFKLVDLTTDPPTETICPSVPQVVDDETLYSYVEYDYAGPAYNHPPALSNDWYVPGSFEIGGRDHLFSFRIRYRDQDGDPPVAKSVVIDGEPREMALSSGVPSDGEYRYETGLPLGSHSHFYAFQDGRGGSARAPLAGAYEGPEVYPFIISFLNPNYARRGGDAFTLSVRGPSLAEGAVVRWDGNDRPTTRISQWELWASIGEADLAEAKLVEITVRDPDGTISNPLRFQVYLGRPHISAVFPRYATGGGSGMELTLYGSPFLPSSVAFWNGALRATTYIRPYELRAQILSSDLAASGENEITVLTPDPSSGLSEAFLFPVSGFQIEPRPAQLTVRAGVSVGCEIRVKPVLAAFDAPVVLSCPNLPKGVTASFAPASVVPGNGQATSVLTLTTTARQGQGMGSTMASRGSRRPKDAFILLAVSALFALSAMGLRYPRRLARGSFMAAVAICLIALVFSCSSGGAGDTKDAGTPAGTYSIEVRGTSNGLSTSALVALIVN